MGQEYNGNVGSAGFGRTFGAFTFVPTLLVLRQEDTEYGPVGEGGAVLDGLCPGDRALYL